MEPRRLIDQLALGPRLPVAALRAASADRAAAVPVFLEAIEQYLSSGNSRARDALFFIFHLLGEWREKSAYRPLARLLRSPPDAVDLIFGGAITETTHRVMAAVFDGDPDPLYGIIRDVQADEFIRSRMCEVIAMVTRHGELPRAEAARFLHACHTELQPQDDCFVWNGWQSAIALLGLAELKPLVQQAFACGSINSSWLAFADFEQDLQQTIDDPAALPQGSRGEYSLFGDTVKELSSWYCFNRDRRDAKRDHVGLEPLWSPGLPTANPMRNVGRNDPCPCGSGRKFKKCCLSEAVGPTVLPGLPGA